MNTKKISKFISVIFFSAFYFSCVAQNQKIILDKKNIHGQWLPFSFNLDNVNYRAYLSDMNEDGLFASPNIDAFGFIEHKTKKQEFLLQKQNLSVKAKKRTYTFELVEESSQIILTISKQKHSFSKFDVNIYNVFIPSLLLKNLETGENLDINELVKKSSKRYLMLNFWSPFCEPCLKSFSELSETANLSVELVNISMEEANSSALSVLEAKTLSGHFYYINKSDITIGGYPQYLLYDIRTKKLLQLSHNIDHILNYTYKHYVQN